MQTEVTTAGDFQLVKTLAELTMNMVLLAMIRLLEKILIYNADK